MLDTGATAVNKRTLQTFLVGQWLRFSASTAEGTGSIPGWGSSAWHSMGSKKKKRMLHSGNLESRVRKQAIKT